MAMDEPLVDDEFRHVQTLFLTADGHFGLPRKDKIDDPDDVSLISGRGIFPADADFQKYLANVGDSPEKSTCAKLNAVEMQNKLKFRGCKVTGVVAVNCARHNLFRYGSMVDLYKGERFANTDYVVAQSLWLARFVHWITLTYDINCQYCVHLIPRLRKHFAGEIVDVARRLTFLIGKLHLRGHKEDCQYRYSLNYTDNCGRVAGEAIEGSWSEAKQAGGSTKEMNHGHRHDTLTDFQNDWNFKKVQGLDEYLIRQLKNARVQVVSKVDHFLRLCKQNGKAAVEAWSQRSTEPELKNGEWQSVYRYQASIGDIMSSLQKCKTCGQYFEPLYLYSVPTQATVFKNMLKAEADRHAHRDSQITTPIAMFLNDGLKLKSKQRTIANMAQRYNQYKSSVDLVELQKSRARFSVELKRWRYNQQALMPSIIDLVVALKPEFPEKEKLYLPSDFDVEARTRYNLEALGLAQLRLCEGEAYDALETTRQAIKYVTSLRADKKQYARGQSMNLRAGEIVKSGEEKQRAAVAKYKASREAILSLGGSDKMFPPLQDIDVTMKDVTSSHKLGDGKKTDSWIWGHGPLGDVSQEERDAFQEQSNRVQWFRARADMARWVEDVEILEAECRRTIAGTKKMAYVWEQLAFQGLKSDKPKLGHVAYATEKSEMYCAMATDCQDKFVAVGGGWPVAGESLTEYIRSHRPKMTFNFPDT
ncbi:hypothetical protein FIBSPDRAFT_963909 [Athelia psychrophila]|uniref:CxC2-like cysteine cluster KDZ transposase-associated domain-containing protein n=1 Tax=Athelia psychrophila TaxID=1759441 RepID=A0A165YFU7_9AGAM|nr:hypothetical protein FIBSPDRAFT_963909 [Fibularhizoctonia sp. CBS 109695]